MEGSRLTHNQTRYIFEMNTFGIEPEGIRGKPLYCLVKLEQKLSKNKPDKIPYQITGARAYPSNERHFELFEDIKVIF